MSVKRFLTVSLGLAISSFINAQAPSFKWAAGMGAPSNDDSRAIAVDAQGNVYTTGYYTGIADFDPGAGTATLASAGNWDVFVSKLDSSGNYLWAKSMGGPRDEFSSGMGVDAQGNVFTTGEFKGTVDFDPGPGVYNLTALDSTDAFISKLDASGNFLWAKSIGGGGGPDLGAGLALDAGGNVYVTGSFYNTVDFDPGPGTYTVSTVNYQDLFILKLDGAGNFVYVKCIGSNWYDYANAITVDAAGNIYTAGTYYGLADFDPGPGSYTLNASSNYNYFILKLDTGGNFTWAKNLGSGARSIAADAQGYVYATGNFYGTFDFDPGPGSTTLTSGPGGFSDSFILKLDAQGSFVWVKKIDGISDQDVYGLALDAAGNVFTTGSFWGTSDFDPGPGIYTITATAPVADDVFILKLDPSGSFVWVTTFGGNSGDEGSALATDPAGNLYASGFFRSIVDFDPGPSTYTLYSTVGQSDIFVLKLGDCSAPAAPLDATPLNNKLVCLNAITTLSALGYGNINWYAGATGTTALAAGPAYTLAGLSTGTVTYYAGASTCTNSAARTAITLTVDACLGLKNNLQHPAGIKLYPNPFNVSALLEADISLDGAELNIYNIMGQKVRTQSNARGNTFSIERGDLEQGVYFYELREPATGTRETGRLVIGD